MILLAGRMSVRRMLYRMEPPNVPAHNPPIGFKGIVSVTFHYIILRNVTKDIHVEERPLHFSFGFDENRPAAQAHTSIIEAQPFHSLQTIPSIPYDAQNPRRPLNPFLVARDCE